MKILEHTTSHLLETAGRGGKVSHFASFKASFNDVSESDLLTEHLKLKRLAVKACLQDALACGDVSVEEYNEKLSLFDENVKYLTEGSNGK
jgi:hypothetical protein